MLYKRHPFSVLITTVASWHQPQQVMIIILTQCVKSTLFRIKKIKASFIYCVLAAPGERQIKSEFQLRASYIFDAAVCRWGSCGLFLTGNASCVHRNTTQWKTLKNHWVVFFFLFFLLSRAMSEGAGDSREEVNKSWFQFSHFASFLRQNVYITSVACREIKETPAIFHPLSAPCLLQYLSYRSPGLTQMKEMLF